MTSSVQIDTRDFEAAIEEYAAVTGKTMVAAQARQLRNWIVKAISRTPQAYGAGIRFLRTEYRLVAYLLRQRVEGRRLTSSSVGTTVDVGGGTAVRTAGGWRARGYQTVYFKAGRKRKDGTRNVRLFRGTGAFYTRQQARDFARKHFGARLASATFAKAFLIKCAQEISKEIGGSRTPGRVHVGISGGAAATTDGRTEYNVWSWATYTYKRGETAAGKPRDANHLWDKLIFPALDSCLFEVVADIRAYTAQKLQEAYDRRRSAGGLA